MTNVDVSHETSKTKRWFKVGYFGKVLVFGSVIGLILIAYLHLDGSSDKEVSYLDIIVPNSIYEQFNNEVYLDALSNLSRYDRQRLMAFVGMWQQDGTNLPEKITIQQLLDAQTQWQYRSMGVLIEK